MKEYYKFLGIPASSTADEIKKVYRQLALKYHPDRNQGNEQAEIIFKLINEANEVLSNSEARASYDLAYHKAKMMSRRKLLIRINVRRVSPFFIEHGRLKRRWRF